MSDRNIRWGRLTGASKDVGPYKLVEVESDGKMMDIMVVEPFGVQSSPHRDGQVLLFVIDGDEGKAVGLIMPRPKDRIDGLKEGEVQIAQFDMGQFLKFDKDGNTILTTTKDRVEEVSKKLTIKTGDVIYINC